MATTEKKLNSVITKLERERAHVSTLRANEDNLRAQCQQLKREARSTRAEAIELVHANTSLQRTKAMEQERERLEASYQHEVDLIKVLHETELADVESTKLSLAVLNSTLRRRSWKNGFTRKYNVRSERRMSRRHACSKPSTTIFKRTQRAGKEREGN